MIGDPPAIRKNKAMAAMTPTATNTADVITARTTPATPRQAPAPINATTAITVPYLPNGEASATSVKPALANATANNWIAAMTTSNPRLNPLVLDVVDAGFTTHTPDY